MRSAGRGRGGRRGRAVGQQDERAGRQRAREVAQVRAEPLGGRRPIVVKAEVGDKSIYRVRVSSLSREEAVSLCEKVKAEGGTCFVAKN